MRLEGLGMRLYRVCTCIHNAFHTRKCNVRAYLNFSIWGAKLLAEVENMAVLQFLTLGGSGGNTPPGNFGNFICSEAHSGAF